MQENLEKMTKHLTALKKSDLIDLVTKYAESDRIFREFIELNMELFDRNRDANLDHFKIAIDNAFGDDNLGPFLSPDKEARIDRLIDSIKELAAKGRAEDALEIVEYSFKYVKNIAESVMEPDYFLSSCFDDLIDIHKLACKRSGIDQEILAERIFTWENSDQYGVFLNLNKCYADVLDSRGVSKYKELRSKILSR